MPQKMLEPELSPRWVACSIFRREFDHLQSRGDLPGVIHWVDSRWHMRPEGLAGKLTSLGERLKKAGGPIIFVYGDCCPRMDEIEKNFGAARPQVHNCVQMLVTDDRFREFKKRGAFAILPGWAGRWRVFLRMALGPDAHWAKEMMRECHREIIYLDTGRMPVPVKEMEACARYFDLPWRPEAVDLGVMHKRLLDAAERTIAHPQESMS